MEEESKKELVIITGMSGAGKNTALNIFESQGYFCTDNLPGLVVEDFLRIIGVQEDKIYEEVEGIEHHFGKNSLEKIKELIKYLKENNYKA